MLLGTGDLPLGASKPGTGVHCRGGEGCRAMETRDKGGTDGSILPPDL